MTAHPAHGSRPKRTIIKIARRLAARLHWLAFALWAVALLLALMPLLL